VSDSPELFELDTEEDDDIVAPRLRRADKARRSARKKEEGASSGTTPDPQAGTLADLDDADSFFELDPPDDDILIRPRRGSKKSTGGPAPVNNGRWFAAAIGVGVVAGVVLGIVMSSNKDDATDPHAAVETTQPAGMDILEQMDPALPNAIAEQKAVLEADPNNFDARMQLGFLYSEFGSLDLALEQWTEAQKISPDRSEPHYWLAMGYYLLVDPPDVAAARTELQKAVGLSAPGSQEREASQQALDALDNPDGASP